MKKTASTIPWKKYFETAEDCLKKSIQLGIPAAIWKLPNQNQIKGIIDFSFDPKKTVKDIEQSESGFLINSFDDHHPSEPHLIKADVIFTWPIDQPQSFEAEVAPTVSSSKIEALFEQPVEVTASLANQSSHSCDFKEIVSQAIDQIKLGTFSKVVLSRYAETSLPKDFDLINFFETACQAYPNAFCYLAYTPESGTWMGATPETLLKLDHEGIFETMSLAGTQKLGDRSLEDIAWTQKDIEEQAMVSRYVIDCFKKIRLREFEENGPRTSVAGNLVHLKTTYRVDTQSLKIDHLATTMMNLLHPTSAVCGMPLLPALSFIKSHEQYERKLYSGFLGPTHIEGITHLFVNLRCMQMINDQTARLYAGAGITADSNPEKEFAETEMKMNTLKKLLDN